jgi:hypothetical protein
MNQALERGSANAEIIELARRHCTKMRFTATVGGGMAEAVSRLPVGSRVVHCPYANGAESSNLEWIAGDFYEENCVGCAFRTPTGELPNLASVFEARKAETEAAAAAEQHAREQQHASWRARVEHRRALRASLDLLPAQVIDDLGLIDHDPTSEVDIDQQAVALSRLTALAERASEAFTAEVIDMSLSLVRDIGCFRLLTPLRLVAAQRQGIAQLVLSEALSTLRQAPRIEAGRCVAELGGHLRPADLTDDVLRSLVFLAGMPSEDEFGRRRGNALNEPAALRVAASASPDAVVTVLKDMLPRPRMASSLVTRLGAPVVPIVNTDLDRASAAEAIMALASTHPEVASRVVTRLSDSLGVDDEDSYNTYATARIQRALAAMVVLEVGDVRLQIESAGATAGEELRKRLFGVYQQVEHFMDLGSARRLPGDPRPEGERYAQLLDLLVEVALKRAGGDWGHHTAYDAAQLVERLAKHQPHWALEHLDQLLGAFLRAVAEIDRPPSSLLTVVDATPGVITAMEEYDRQQSHSATARELLDAVEHAADADALGVCRTLCSVLREERDNEWSANVAWRVIRVLGRIGQNHGDQTTVLRVILPTLHTYLVDAEASLRAIALNAWIDIAVHHPVPSSVADLLPALIKDNAVRVAEALLRAARSLVWNDETREELTQYACRLSLLLDPHDNRDLLKSALSTLRHLCEGPRRPLAERVALQRAHDIAGRRDEVASYDLREVLGGRWTETASRSAEMAQLRLQLARDPRINDRLNQSDDEEICDLLECGPGLSALTLQDLTDAACELDRRWPLASAEFVEVASRAGRPDDAAAVARAVLDATPNVPAFDPNRSLLQPYLDGAEFDAVALNGGDVSAKARQLLERLAGAEDEDETALSGLHEQLSSIAKIRLLLAGEDPQDPTEGNAGRHRSPAAALCERADALERAASDLDRHAQRVTPTAEYVRKYVSLCRIAEHLIRYDAAELDADATTGTAEQTAAKRQAEILREHLARSFAPDDPLAAPLADAAESVASITSGEVVAATLASWVALSVPILAIRGPRRRREFRSGSDDNGVDTSERQVAVVLASIDGRLITGPLVLRPTSVYELRLEVRPDKWPEWADHLDAELIGHLTETEIELPTFSWDRPAAADIDPDVSGEGTLILRFNLGAGQPAPPFRVSLRWRGERDGALLSEYVDVAGHTELRFRPFDATRDFLTKDRVYDEKLLALYERLRAAGFDEEQLQAFCRLFTAICRAGISITWSKKYKRGTSDRERDFHDDLFERLSNEPELGGRVERGSPLALGYLDVRHDGITAELKVEKKVPVTSESARHYMSQPAQYGSADGSRLSILCILDLSEKTSPLGTPENYFFPLQPAIHGVDEPTAPPLVVTIVINGNVPVPSWYSRRKTRLQAPPGEKP